MDKLYTRYVFTHPDVCKKAQWVMSHKNKKFDFVALGNSRVDNMTDIKGIENITGKTGINLGYTGSNFSEMYLLFNQFIKNGNITRNLLLEVDQMGLNAKKVDFKLHYPAYLHLFNDTLVNNVYKQNAEGYNYYLWNYIPFARYMEYSNNFVLYKMIKGGFECKEDAALDSNKGTEFITIQKMGKDWPITHFNIDPKDVEWLKKIIATAKRNNIPVIFYTAPIYTPYLKTIDNYHIVTDQLRAIARSENIPYFNFVVPNTSICTNGEDYFDETHLKIAGAEKFSAMLADSIKPYLN